MTAGPKLHSLLDGVRPVEFTGTIIGDVSNETPDRNRWTEVNLYRTTGGNYVLHVVARSVVFHATDGCGTANGEKMSLEEATRQDGEACTFCVNKRSATFNICVMEGDRHQTRVFTNLKELQAGVNEFGGLGRQVVERAVQDGNITAADLQEVKTVVP